jgi:hypothetical protein
VADYFLPKTMDEPMTLEQLLSFRERFDNEYDTDDLIMLIGAFDQVVARLSLMTASRDQLGAIAERFIELLPTSPLQVQFLGDIAQLKRVGYG